VRSTAISSDRLVLEIRPLIDRIGSSSGAGMGSPARMVPAETFFHSLTGVGEDAAFDDVARYRNPAPRGWLRPQVRRRTFGQEPSLEAFHEL
jgi:hypothetical protein